MMKKKRLVINQTLALLLLLLAMSLLMIYLFHQNYILSQKKTEKNLLTLMNEARAKIGVQPLVFSDKLRESAKEKACDMVDNNYFEHDSPKGKTPWDFIHKQGIHYKDAGENLAIGYKIEEDKNLFLGWMNSPEHKANILNPKFSEVGWYGCGEYVAQHFVGFSLSPSTSGQQTDKPNLTIDCIGPDGKYLQVTKEECDSFNAVWGNLRKNYIMCEIIPGQSIKAANREQCETLRESFKTQVLDK
jgi:hypothetical protein